MTGTDDQFLVMSDYMHMRNYAPKLSRFVTPDSKPGFHLFNPEDANRYAYGLNNPTTFVDPTGLDEVPNYVVRMVGDGKNSFTTSTGAEALDPYRETQRLINSWMLGLGAFSWRGAAGTASRTGIGGSNRPEQFPLMTWNQFTFRGGAAFIDGAIPIPGWDPLADFNLYDRNDLGMSESKFVGGVTAAVAGGLVTAETATLARIGVKASGNAFTKNLFRWGYARWGSGAAHRSGWHAHLWPAMKHHLPSEFKTWSHHSLAIFRDLLR